MKKLLSLVLVGIMMLSSISVFAADVSFGAFVTEYLEYAKELEFSLDLNEGQYWELYVYNHSDEKLKIQINKGARTLHKEEIESKKTIAIYGEGNFDKDTYIIKATSLGTKNLSGKLSYHIANSEDNLQRKEPESLKEMKVNTPLGGGEPGYNVIKAKTELSNYGILKGDPDGNLRLFDIITRAEATALITRMNANYNDILKDYLYRPTFDDIGNHWAAKEITFAHENALVEGTSETTFEPDKNVTVQDFTKMLVTLLGYKEMAEQQGGFPHGYMMTGSRLGLFKDLYLEGPDDVTRATVAVMLVNSLDVPLMRMSGFDFSENTAEFIIMDGKNGVELETFRTILEEK